MVKRQNLIKSSDPTDNNPLFKIVNPAESSPVACQGWVGTVPHRSQAGHSMDPTRLAHPDWFADQR